MQIIRRAHAQTWPKNKMNPNNVNWFDADSFFNNAYPQNGYEYQDRYYFLSQTKMDSNMDYAENSWGAYQMDKETGKIETIKRELTRTDAREAIKIASKYFYISVHNWSTLGRIAECLELGQEKATREWMQLLDFEFEFKRALFGGKLQSAVKLENIVVPMKEFITDFKGA